MKKILVKLSSNKGESISEVLVASLVIALALIMLVTMTMSAFRLTRNAENAFNDYYDSENNAETSAGEEAPGYSLKIEHGESEQEQNDVTFYKNGDDIITFRRSQP